MFDSKGRFIIENYNRKTTFSSFLPGISGLHGIPVWSFYVNRGQAVAGFGTEDKNHSIMEFYPAHQAYQLTKTLGFRTFMKVDGEYFEPFRSDDAVTRMYIGMNELEIEEVNEKLGVKINVLYYTLPSETVGGMVRTVTVQNCLDQVRSLELLDGMPAVIPYGIDLPDLKEMAQTMKAWMQVEDLDQRLPYYRVRYSTKDSAAVSRVQEGNFMAAVDERGERMQIIGDPELIFDYDTSYERPVGFLNRPLAKLTEERQITQNQVPCGFACWEGTLKAKGGVTVSSIIGQVKRKEILREFADRIGKTHYFEEKHEEAVRLTRDLCSVISTRTANAVFDEYCRQTYLDNVLRGGVPVKLGRKHIFYAYSRKHGDMERDYNFFRMLPEYFSQGNGNFRDVNQNRRSDVLFSPYVKDHNIRMFYNLIQLDGYNPLSVNQTTYRVKDAGFLKELVEEKALEALEGFFKDDFTPGGLLHFLEAENITGDMTGESFLNEVMNHAEENLNADFQEGYWTDHWTYNLDLLESFLTVYPEKGRAVLFEDCSYTYYEAEAVVRPRAERYVKTPDGMRQYHAVETVKRDAVSSEVRTRYGKGERYRSTLFAKLTILAVNKFATLDMCGMGIEMEGGKPGWYDALNGLPGIFGSSMSETYELQRLLLFMRQELERFREDVVIPEEAARFITGAKDTIDSCRKNGKSPLWVWNELNIQKEIYREKTRCGISGEQNVISWEELCEVLVCFMEYVQEGIEKACKESPDGIAPTYFAYEFADYETVDGHMIPVGWKTVPMPLFLEGPVHMLKLPLEPREKKVLYDKIKTSGLYDRKLSMYKVNASLEDAPFEVGRAKAFSPGWLENESIWLHMEYKYLLELLKSGMYQEFFADLKTACVPFMEYETYGRSLLENSSFIASSANQNEKIHGKGFVARLSGSTAEFLQMWQMMMFGKCPFTEENGELCCSFQPSVPDYLIPEDLRLEAMFLGTVNVVYDVNSRNSLIPGHYCVERMCVKDRSENERMVNGNCLKGPMAEAVRNGEIKEIQVFLV